MNSGLNQKNSMDPVDVAIRSIHGLTIKAGPTNTSERVKSIVSRLGRGDAYLVKCALTENGNAGLSELKIVAPQIYGILMEKIHEGERMSFLED